MLLSGSEGPCLPMLIIITGYHAQTICFIIIKLSDPNITRCYMPSQNQPYTYEHIKFHKPDFPFGAFVIPDSTTLPHWHNHTEFVYAQKGAVDVYINGSKYPCQENDILLIPGNSLHSIIPVSQATYVAIVIGDELLKELLHDPQFAAVTAPLTGNSRLDPCHFSGKAPVHAKLQKNIVNIISEAQNTRPYRELYIKLEICQFMAVWLRQCPSFHTSFESSGISHTAGMKVALEYLSNHYSEKINIKDMAALMNMSEQHFSRLFKAYTGKTFVEYLTLYRLEQANKLLHKSDLPITQIPELTGFCNPNYFSRVYRNQYGYAPSAVRK